MKNWRNVFTEHFIRWSAKICSTFTVLIILGILFCITLHLLQPNAREFFEQHTTQAQNNEDLTTEERLSLDKLISKNKVIPISVVYEDSIRYYDSLISIMGFLIAVLGVFVGLGAFLSYISIRSKIADGIKEEMQSELSSKFFEAYINRIAEAATEKQISEKLPDWVKNQENYIEEVVERVKNEIEKSKEKLSLTIPDSDHDERE